MLVFVHTQLGEPEGSTPRRLGLSMKEKHLDFFLSGWKHVAVKRGSFDLSMFLDVVGLIELGLKWRNGIGTISQGSCF